MIWKSEPVRQHIRNWWVHLIKMDTLPVPWPRMMVAMIAVAMPLGVGYENGQAALSVYGALMGYLLALNDHLGTLKQRMQIVTFTFFFLLAGFALGFWAHENVLIFYFLIPILIYWIGLLGGEGAEAERALLFFAISIVISYSSKPLSPEGQKLLFHYALIAYITVMVAIPVLLKIRPRAPENFIGFRNNLKRSLSLTRAKHIHAFSYAAAALFALWLAEYFKLDRGYWIVITVLLVMRADRTLSIYTSFQRLLGTALGVLVFDIVLLFHPPVLLLMLWAVLCGFWVPFSLKRNYVLASFFITTFVVSLLEIGITARGAYASDVIMPFLRLKATFIGCSIAVLGTLVSFILSSIGNRFYVDKLASRSGGS